MLNKNDCSWYTQEYRIKRYEFSFSWYNLIQKISENCRKVIFSSDFLSVNNRLKNYCAQMNIDYIENKHVKEKHLESKKLQLSKEVILYLPIS